MTMSKREQDRLDRAEHQWRVWFRENSEAQAALGRVRELCNEWATAGGIHRLHAALILAALDGEGA